MKRYPSIILAACFVIAADAPKDRATREELKKLQGTWRPTYMEKDGRKVPEEAFENRMTVVVGDRYELKVGDRTIQRGTLRIDPTTTPKRVENIPNDGPNAGKTDLGIYELDGDTLKMCFAPPDQERPTRFKTEPGTGQWLFIDKRDNP